jgi:hypothetical protein
VTGIGLFKRKRVDLCLKSVQWRCFAVESDIFGDLSDSGQERRSESISEVALDNPSISSGYFHHYLSTCLSKSTFQCAASRNDRKSDLEIRFEWY